MFFLALQDKVIKIHNGKFFVVPYGKEEKASGHDKINQYKL
jgi:hypothetical protein